MVMSTSWGNKLEQRLSPSSLADSASKESIQALAKWIGFNRKHAKVIADTLGGALQSKSNSDSRQWLYWQVIHEVLMLDAGTQKWERLVELRSTIGEVAVIPSIEVLRASGSLTTADKVESLIKQWDDNDVFGGPTLVSQIRRLMTSEIKVQPGEPAHPESPRPTAEIQTKITADSVTATLPVKQELSAANPDADNVSSSVEATNRQHEEEDKLGESKPTEKRSSLSHITKEVSYDFEAKVRYPAILPYI